MQHPNLPYRLMGVVLSTLGLLACAQPSYDWSAHMLPPPNLLNIDATARPAAPTSLRVMVQFKESVAGDDANVLQVLQAQSGGPLRFLSSVSTDTHVYSLQLAANQDVAQALQRLATAPGVKRVERDQNVKAH